LTVAGRLLDDPLSWRANASASLRPRTPTFSNFDEESAMSAHLNFTMVENPNTDSAFSVVRSFGRSP
jgi:hypothetical protein